jgi:hypothetical protein
MAEVIVCDGARPASPGHTDPWWCNGLLMVLACGHTTHKVWPIQLSLPLLLSPPSPMGACSDHQVLGEDNREESHGVTVIDVECGQTRGGSDIIVHTRDLASSILGDEESSLYSIDKEEQFLIDHLIAQR